MKGHSSKNPTLDVPKYIGWNEVRTAPEAGDQWGTQSIDRNSAILKYNRQCRFEDMVLPIQSETGLPPRISIVGRLSDAPEQPDGESTK